MNLQQAEKLKGLIAVSSILSPAEKQEWDMLLELMNDKQMVELEKILLSSFNQKPDAQNAKLVLPPVLETVKKESENKPQAPALGHILNMPKVGVPRDNGIISNIAQPAFEANKTAGLSKSSKTGFLQKLTSILKEPELPAGQREELLPAKAESDQIEGVVEPFKLKEQPKQEQFNMPVPKPPIKQTKAEPTAPVIQKASKLPNKLPDQKAEEILKGIKSWPSRYELSKKITPSQVQAQQEKAPEVSQQPKQVKQVAEEKPAQIQSKPSFSSELEPQPTDEAFKDAAVSISLNEPKDLEKFTYQNLGKETVKNLRDMLKKFGYFEVIFHLEKSPLYKDYIQTGSQLLQTSKALEEQGGKSQGGFDRKKFEEVADLLRDIQAE